MESRFWVPKSFRWENDILMKKTCYHTFLSEAAESDELNSKTELCVLHHVRPFVCVAVALMEPQTCFQSRLSPAPSDWSTDWLVLPSWRALSDTQGSGVSAVTADITCRDRRSGWHRFYGEKMTSLSHILPSDGRIQIRNVCQRGENQKSGFYLMNVLMVMRWLGGLNESAETDVILLSSVSTAALRLQVVALNLDFTVALIWPHMQLSVYRSKLGHGGRFQLLLTIVFVCNFNLV